MKNLYPIKPIVEMLNIQQDKENTTNNRLLLFTPLTKKEVNNFSEALTNYLTYHKLSDKRKQLDNSFKKYHNFTFANVIALGDTKIETRLANTYIESFSIKINEAFRRNFKCFVNKDWKNPKNKMNLPYHDDGGCSWNCLMQKLKNPEFGVIFTIPVNDQHKFNIDGEA